jgi:hypothetical protein
VLQKESKRSARFEWSIGSPRARFLWCASRWDLEAVVVDMNTFITPARAIQFRLFRDLQDEWRQAAHNAASHLSAAARLLNWV